VNAPAPPRALYLRGSGAPLFAFLHSGAAPQRETAVLLCPPFGWEDMCSYRIRREWAEQLALAGYTALRIDLPASGDSAGAPTDPGLLDAWTQAVADAAGWLRGPAGPADANADADADAEGDDWRVPAARVAVIGIGLGGLVACRAALGGAPIDELVLWAVPTRGRALVRELRTFSALELANVRQDGEPAPSAPSADAGTLVTNGYVLSAETVAQLERLDLQEGESSTATVRRALLLQRDGLKLDKALALVLERAGAEVTVADGPGYGAMMVEPQDARAPLGVFEHVSSWLARGQAGDAAPAAAVAERAGERAPAAARPSSRPELVLECAGVQVRERPVSLDGPSGRLFGVLSEPVDGARGLTAVLLNAGPQRRTGPNRMWVEIARRWAAKGVPTLRLDADGIGDSDGDATVLGRVTAFYRPVYVEQARAALEELAGRGLPPRFVALGLCSGAYWSAQAALADERVAAVIMLNPRTLVFDEWRHTVRRTRHLRERALMGSTWRRALRGEIKLAKHLETGRTLAGRAVSALVPRERIVSLGHKDEPTREAVGVEPIEDLFDALRDRGQRSLLMFTGKEVLRRELAEAGVFDRMDRWPSLELALMGTSADTHTLTPLWLQREVHTLVDRVLEDELERIAG
jgi:alpha-beta hydrolase superfamily lysophospholipase